MYTVKTEQLLKTSDLKYVKWAQCLCTGGNDFNKCHLEVVFVFLSNSLGRMGLSPIRIRPDNPQA